MSELWVERRQVHLRRAPGIGKAHIDPATHQSAHQAFRAVHEAVSADRAIRTSMPAARPHRKPGKKSGLRDVRRQAFGRFVSPEDELPADETKLIERIGAWLKQRARIKPPGKSFFVSGQCKALATLVFFVRRNLVGTLK